MRISELGRLSGVSIPTMKFYLREGLLPPGTPTAPNQADYSDDHLRRLRLIRSLSEVGGLTLRQVRSVLEAMDDRRRPLHELLGVAHHALGPPLDEEPPAADVVEAREDVDRFLSDRGWRVSPEAPARRALAQALATLRRLGRAGDVAVLEPYARVADRLAAVEVGTLAPSGSRAEAVEAAVLGTVLFEAVLVALRRLAQEHHSASRLARDPGRTSRVE
jgi:DNA-binding transcriptional MerR regulator